MDLLHVVWIVFLNFLNFFILASGKILTIITLAMRANPMARAFMISTESMKAVLAVMGTKSIIELDKSSLTYTNRNGEVFFDIDVYFKNKLHL